MARCKWHTPRGSLDPIFKAADFHARAWSQRAAQSGDAGEDVAMDDGREAVIVLNSDLWGEGVAGTAFEYMRDDDMNEAR